MPCADTCFPAMYLINHTGISQGTTGLMSLVVAALVMYTQRKQTKTLQNITKGRSNEQKKWQNVQTTLAATLAN